MIVLVGLGGGVVSVLFEPAHHIIHRDVEAVLAYLSLPHIIGLGKEGEAVIPVLGKLAGGVAYARLMGNHLWHLACLIGQLVLVIPVSLQGVEHAHSMYEHRGNVVARLLFGVYLVEEVAQGVVCGSHHRVHAVDVAVEHTYVIVARVHQRTVDGDAVGVVEVVDYQLAVIHVVLRELAAVVDGELGHIIGREIVAAVDDAIIYDDFADGVEGGAVAEAIPTGTCYDVLHGQSVEVSLHGVVVGGKYCEMAASGKQRTYCGTGHSAHRHLVQQIHKTAVLLVLAQITVGSLFLQDIACAHVDVFFAGTQPDCY